MSTSSESTNSLLEQVQARERKARQTAFLLTMIPVIVAVLLIWYTTSQIKQMNDQVQASKDDLTDANTQLTNAKVQIKVYQDQLGQAQNSLGTLKSQQAGTSKRLSDLQNQYDGLRQQYDNLINSMRNIRSFSYQRDPLLALKVIGSQHPSQGEVLTDMVVDLKNAPWKLGGISPQEGFDSAGMAAFVLQKYKLISQPASAARNTLPQLLKQESQPKAGDVVFYELGYTMFYYLDDKGDPFVVGMTPLGVLALKPDFAKVISYGQVDYP